MTLPGKIDPFYFDRHIRWAELALMECMNAVELEVKSSPIAVDEDIAALALDCFEKLRSKMEKAEKDENLDSLVMSMTLDSVEPLFKVPSAIRKDLRKYQADPKPPSEPVWYIDICRPEPERL